jgi:hypothetical protein
VLVGVFVWVGVLVNVGVRLGEAVYVAVRVAVLVGVGEGKTVLQALKSIESAKPQTTMLMKNRRTFIILSSGFVKVGSLS